MIDVLKYGQMVRNPAFWKKMQYRVTLLTSLIPFIATIYPPSATVLTPELLGNLYTALGGFNIYFTVATTEKIGLKSI
jgi:hypothetical protein